MKYALTTIFSLVVGIAIGFYSHENSTQSETSINIDNLYVVPLPTKPTNKQTALLALAYQTAKRDGLEHPQLLQGILLQESHAGELASYKVAGHEYGLKPNHRYYGVAQIKLDAAFDVLKRYPDMWMQFGFQTRTDEEVIAKLIENDAFNIAVASKYLMILHASGYNSPSALAVAYNKGASGAASINVHEDRYAVGVSQYMRSLPLGVIRDGDPKTANTAIYHVAHGDSLSRIATMFGSSMDAIFHANPSAFVNGDKNLLMAGVDLKMPEMRT